MPTRLSLRLAYVLLHLFGNFLIAKTFKSNWVNLWEKDCSYFRRLFMQTCSNVDLYNEVSNGEHKRNSCHLLSLLGEPASFLPFSEITGAKCRIENFQM